MPTADSSKLNQDLAAFLGGNSLAGALVYTHMRGAVLAIVRDRAPDLANDRQDVLNEAFVLMMEAPHRFDPERGSARDLYHDGDPSRRYPARTRQDGSARNHDPGDASSSRRAEVTFQMPDSAPASELVEVTGYGSPAAMEAACDAHTIWSSAPPRLRMIIGGLIDGPGPGRYRDGNEHRQVQGRAHVAPVRGRRVTRPGVHPHPHSNDLRSASCRAASIDHHVPWLVTILSMRPFERRNSRAGSSRGASVMLGTSTTVDKSRDTSFAQPSSNAPVSTSASRSRAPLRTQPSHHHPAPVARLPRQPRSTSRPGSPTGSAQGRSGAYGHGPRIFRVQPAIGASAAGLPPAATHGAAVRQPAGRTSRTAGSAGGELGRARPLIRGLMSARSLRSKAAANRSMAGSIPAAGTTKGNSGPLGSRRRQSGVRWCGPISVNAWR